jgi:hypothetical protein
MIFRAFRLIATGLLLLGAAALAGYAAGDLVEALSADDGAAGLIGPIVRVVFGALLAIAAYYCLWSPSPIRKNLENICAIPELVRKLVFTLALLCIYRIGFHVPLPGVDQDKLAEFMGAAGGMWEQAIQTATMFTGGNLQQATLFGLGIMPFISASIIMQLMSNVVPSLEKLRKEGPAGQKKIQEYTRYLTVGLCLVQSGFLINYLQRQGLFYPEYRGSLTVVLFAVFGMTAGTVFLMWLGEQIDEYGIGNGISLLIMAGIVSRMPQAVAALRANATPNIGGEGIDPLKMLLLAGMFVFVVAGAILITQAQRRIPIQQAKHTRGRKVYGGQRQFLPLRVNHGGVMPIIFARPACPNVELQRHTRHDRRGVPGQQLRLDRLLRRADLLLRVFLDDHAVPSQRYVRPASRPRQLHSGSASGQAHGRLPGARHGADDVLRRRIPGRHCGGAHGHRQRAGDRLDDFGLPGRHGPADYRVGDVGLGPADRGQPGDAELRRLPGWLEPH